MNWEFIVGIKIKLSQTGIDKKKSLIKNKMQQDHVQQNSIEKISGNRA